MVILAFFADGFGRDGKGRLKSIFWRFQTTLYIAPHHRGIFNNRKAPLTKGAFLCASSSTPSIPNRLNFQNLSSFVFSKTILTLLVALKPLISLSLHPSVFQRLEMTQTNTVVCLSAKSSAKRCPNEKHQHQKSA
nr:MAG TPA: hypothetical protein [Inoviridae sp.]